MDGIKIIKINDCKIFIESIGLSGMVVAGWLEEQVKVECYGLCLGTKIVTIVLLSKCEYDPYKTHDDPYTINYIYTYPKYRRKGFACEILRRLKTIKELTAFCDNDESEMLFKKAEYIFCGNDKIFGINPVYRSK